MANFVKHESCEQCGSRDNKAIYDDGSSFCFGCRSVSSPSFMEKISATKRDNTNTSHRSLPDDCNSHFSPAAVSWLTQYGMGLDVLIKHHVLFSPSRNQIIFTWPDTPLWQARNLDRKYIDKNGEEKTLPKCFTSGDHSNILPIYPSLPLGFWSDVLIIVEDPVSAIKMASCRGVLGLPVDGMPLLGSHLPTKKLMPLRAYKKIVFWLDHDKGKNSLELSHHVKLLSIQSRCIFTEKDPKEHSYEEINSTLKGIFLNN